jgi:hypothetical protein
MSRDGVGKLLRAFGISAFLWVALPGLGWAQQSCGSSCAVSANSCAQPCQWLCCPPAYRHCQEGPPRLHFHCACPHPVCNPCELPHWGYFETCWYPWPYPPTPCPGSPASMVVLNPYGNTHVPAADPRQPRPTTPPQGMAPAPRTLMTLPPPSPPVDDLNTPRPYRPGQ